MISLDSNTLGTQAMEQPPTLATITLDTLVLRRDMTTLPQDMGTEARAVLVLQMAME